MYPDNYAFWRAEQRMAHWARVLYRGMQWAGEDGHDETSIFDAALIARLRAFDPAIDTLLPQVLTSFAIMPGVRDPHAFMRTVNAQMHTDYALDLDLVKATFPKRYAALAE